MCQFSYLLGFFHSCLRSVSLQLTKLHMAHMTIYARGLYLIMPPLLTSQGLVPKMTCTLVGFKFLNNGLYLKC